MPQNSFKFNKNTFEEFGIVRVTVQERGRDDWVAFMWSKHGQEAVGRGTHLLEALTNAVEYLTNAFHLSPTFFQKTSESLHPQEDFRRNKNNRLLSPAEQILERYSRKKELLQESTQDLHHQNDISLQEEDV